ncbi:uncharacterized protein BJ171DRAFT_171848 [Polychytrium aggregatum]|uniref:uncharacterized protein n=1 Tax=Polychytrium aggregatum TaxID=110093 RepID=UPI0022FF24DC|nr:uncharacterized protein BJ171DRAFT_171848 [Polychytrium aggregatum]KAI9208942.1 hypothetical protein BJ171DRAFT_171848 [Polychytrium aggregatum]
MESSAYPENRYTVTSEDIVQFEQDEQEAAKRKAGESKGGGEENIFGTGTAAPAKDPTPVPPATDPPTTSQSSRPTSSSRSQQRSAESQNTSGLKTSRPNTAGSQKTTSSGRSGSAKSNAGRSNLEILQRDVRRRILKYKKERIKKAMELYIKEFDLTVDALAKERIILEGDVKSADIRLLLLYKEWALLKEFEKHDNFLADKRATKRLEKGEIDSKISECQEKLNSKKTEIEQAIKREKEIHEEFVKLIGENNKHEEFLTKIFKKKIKRSKKKIKTDGEDGENNEENESEEDEEDDDDMDSYDSADDDSDSEGEGAEECPPDYDQGHFNKILTLRERRLDQEDALAEIQKAIEAIKKENDSLLKKEKTIDAALKSTENEIQEFQTQKQQKLNELDVVIPLRLHQIQMLEQNAIPTDFSPALVFLGEGLVKLKNRIRELQQEKNDIKKSHKELKKMHVSLHKSRKEKLFKLQELEARAHDVQMLKFGQTIDLEKLERMGVNRSADELREKLQKEDNIRSKELGDWDLRIGHLKETLTDVTKDNTTRLEHLVGLSESRQQLEDALNTSQSSVVCVDRMAAAPEAIRPSANPQAWLHHQTAEYSGPLQKDVIERRKLIKLVQAQEQEIGRLKQEIEVLIRKPLRQLPPVRYPVEQHGAAQDE